MRINIMRYGNRRIEKLLQQLAVEMAKYDLEEIMDQTGLSSVEAKQAILDYDYSGWEHETGGVIAEKLLLLYFAAATKLRV